MIRQRIVDCYRGAGTELSHEEVMARIDSDSSAVLVQLRGERPLDTMAGLSIEEAKLVLKHFGGLDIFTADIEKAILDFDVAREHIREFEKRAGGDEPSGKE